MTMSWILHKIHTKLILPFRVEMNFRTKNKIKELKLKIVIFYYFLRDTKIELFTLIQFDSDWTPKAFLLFFSLSFALFSTLRNLRGNLKPRESLSLSLSSSKSKYLWNLWLDVDDNNKMRWDGLQIFFHHNFLLLSLSRSVFITHSTTTPLSFYCHHLVWSVNHAQRQTHQKNWEFSFPHNNEIH